MHFNPADVQTIGIGLAAFLSTLVAFFVFFSVGKERVGRAMGIMFVMAAIWSWFGFLYGIAPGLALARELRVVSVMGIVWLSMAGVNFAITYFKERALTGWGAQSAQLFVAVGGVLLTLALIGDLFGGRLVVGNLTQSPDRVLAPNAGPLMAVVIAYYALALVVLGIFLAARARASIDKAERRQAEILFVSLTVAWVLGGTRFAPWYGFDFQPLVGACAAPLFIFAAFYSIKRYKLLNVEVVAAQLLIFALWTFTFFRALLEPTVKDAIPDIGLFVAVLVLGVSLLRSITMEIRTQKELARLTIERVKTEFVTIAAHQLRTPLTAIRWTFNLLTSKGFESLSKDQRDTIHQGSIATNSMVLIINDLLNIARMSGGVSSLVIESGDVRDAVRAGGVLFEEAAKNKNVQLTFEVPPSPLRTKFDHGKLALVIENLIDNAIKYTPSGGSVSVRVESSGDTIIVRVIDTGIGIPHDDQARLFEKFFRGKSATLMFPDGSGLGLFIAKNIIEEHGGTIAVSGGEKGGTTMTIALPVVPV